MLSAEIRDILQVPQSYRACEPKARKRKTFIQPEMPKSLLEDKKNMEAQGLQVESKFYRDRNYPEGGYYVLRAI